MEKKRKIVGSRARRKGLGRGEHENKLKGKGEKRRK